MIECGDLLEDMTTSVVSIEGESPFCWVKAGPGCFKPAVGVDDEEYGTFGWLACRTESAGGVDQPVTPATKANA